MKKKLTRKKAIELCIELWSWLAETGEIKEVWPEWKKYKQYWDDNYWDKSALNHCWFCEYTFQQTERYSPEDTMICSKYCPLFKQIGHCDEKTFYKSWFRAGTKKTCKKYAKLFLEQIKSLR